jgi:peptidoglycan/LPS O-acetylase OafA/YrhL
MQYARSLDGMRGLAVSLVVLFHFGLFPAGWVGVQIFFVLSGYLITSILLLEKDRPFGKYVGRFYWRRSLRIFPLYFAFLAAASASYVAFAKPESFSADWPFLATYTTNFGRLRATDIGPAFIHLWSLAVEEQFYLIWPLLVYFMPLVAFKRTVIAIIALTPFVRLTLYFVFQGHDSEWIGRNIYCLPISQLDAFAAGAAIATWRLQDSLKNTGRLLVVVLIVTTISGAVVVLHDHIFYRSAVKTSLGFAMYLLSAWGFVWGYSLLNVLFALGIVCALQRLAPLRILENSALVRLGTISYGIYVYHVPALLLVKTLPISPTALFVVFCAATFAISEVSHRYLEAPFLAMKNHWLPNTRQQNNRASIP